MNPADPRDHGGAGARPHPPHGAVMMLPRLVGGLRCLDVIREMEDHLVVLTGARDRKGTPILTFPQNPRREKAKPEDFKRLLDYLLGVPWYVSCKSPSSFIVSLVPLLNEKLTYSQSQSESPSQCVTSSLARICIMSETLSQPDQINYFLILETICYLHYKRFLSEILEIELLLSLKGQLP